MRLREVSRIDTIIVHCSSTEDSAISIISIDEVRRWHLKKGWHDIGYHFYINREGMVTQGRPIQYVGAHTKGFNDTSLGICLEGTDTYNQIQLDALLELDRKLISLLSLTYDHWRTHNYFDSNKTCPGFSTSQLRSFIETGIPIGIKVL